MRNRAVLTRPAASPWRLFVLFGLALGLSPLLWPGGATATASATGPGTAAAEAPADAVELLYFGSTGCPYCAEMELLLDDLESRVGPALHVERFEVSGDAAARELWQRELEDRGLTPTGTPTTILGDAVWVGYNSHIGLEVSNAVDREIAAMSGADAPDITGPVAPDQSGTMRVPIFGDVELADRSAFAVTVLIAFVDGFNPCSLWVLTVLLAMVLNAGASRRRVAAVGVTFLSVTALIYGAFMVGIFTVLGLVEQINTIRAVVAAVALIVGAVNVKDYFAYKKGLSFTIPDRFKPRIYRSGRAIRDQERPLVSVMLMTVVLAAGVSLVELPCTAGFPLVWTGTLRSMGVEAGPELAGLLGLYLLVYLIDELLIFVVVLATLRISRFEERHGRALKLVGGSVMVALGVTMLAAPHLLDHIGGLIAVTVGAAVLAAVLAGAARVLRRPTKEPAGRR